MFFVPSVPLWVAKLSPLPQELIWVNFRFNDLNKPLKMVINEINTICNLQYRVGILKRWGLTEQERGEAECYPCGSATYVVLQKP